MGRQVLKKGIQYFKKNGFKKACRRTVYFFTERNSYEKLRKHCAASSEELERQRNEKFAYAPRISIIIPMYNTPIKFFEELVECVKAQTYSNWELCLADGTGKESESGEYAKNCASVDNRIIYKLLDSNDGISGNTNQALNMATGDFVVLMDHDDLIDVDALYYLVRAVNENPNTDSVYSDEDKMDMEGKTFFEPNYKSDFNIDLLRNCNYICHIFMTRTKIAKEIGGFRKEYDGAQDFDFIFRCVEKSRYVAHVPRVIYHWRCHVNSTAAVPESKMYAYNSGVNSIKGHFERTGISMSADMGPSFGYYKNNYILKDTPKVTLIVHGDDIAIEAKKNRILSLLGYENIEAITCKDNTKALNEACKKAIGEYLFFVDSRITDITKDAVENLLGYAYRDDVCAACGKTVGQDDLMYHAFLLLGVHKTFGYAFSRLNADTTGYFMRNIAPQDVSAADLSCTLIKKSIFEKLEGFDEQFDVIYGAADFFLKLRVLREEMSKEATNSMVQDMCKVVYVPYSQCKIDVYPSDNWRVKEKEYAFLEKWPELVNKSDSYYNVNLTRKDTSFKILSSMEIKAKDL